MGDTRSFFAVGAALKHYRTSRGMPQLELAAMLGVSQPYLSRLESGRRHGLSPSLWEKVSSLLGVDFLSLVNPRRDELSDQYERALLSLGGGDLATAEALFMGVANSLKPQYEESAAALDLYTRSVFRVAGIRRDRNEICGNDGALSIYAEVSDIYSRRGQLRRLQEVRFVVGAAHEMLREGGLALAAYTDLIREHDGGSETDFRMATRLHTRAGALLTKMGDLVAAEKHLLQSVALAPILEDSGPYSLTHEKLGILEIRRGRLLEANDELELAGREVRSTEHLRVVQHGCARADLFGADGDTTRERLELERALVIARAQEYRHQEGYISRRLRPLTA